MSLARLIQRSLDFDNGVLATRRTTHRMVLTPTATSYFRALSAVAMSLHRASVESILSHYGDRTDADGRSYVLEWKPGIRCLDVDNVERRARLPVLADAKTDELEILVPRKECDTCTYFRAAKKPYCQLAREHNQGRTAELARKAIKDAEDIVSGKVPESGGDPGALQSSALQTQEES